MACWISSTEWETLLVGIIGFGGVIATIFFNAHVSRRERLDELKHLRQTLRSALKTELSINLETIKAIPEEKINNYAEFTTGLHLTKSDISLEFYNSNVSKIGILDEDEMLYVLDAYLCLTSAIKKVDFLTSMIKNPQQEFPEDVENRFQIFKNMKHPIEKAIHSIQEKLDEDSR